MLTIRRETLEQLSALLLERAGLKIASDGYHSLRLALSARLPALGLSDAADYLVRLQGDAGEVELRALLPLVTVGHTEFFRDPRQFAALERRVLPEVLSRARRHARKVSIWSAGCATGEEPYSLAMLLHELQASPLEVDLWATDVNPAAVESARVGRFSARRAGSLGPQRLGRYFQRLEDGYEVQPVLKELIRFDIQNLAAPVFGNIVPGSLDLILCRNVIIYFDLPTIRGLMDRFLSALRPGGLLFLGYSESLFRVYDRFEMVEVEGAYVYRRPPEGTPVRRTLPPVAPELVAPPRRPTGEWRSVGTPAPTPAPPPLASPTPPPSAAARPVAITRELPALRGPQAARSPLARLEAAARQMNEGRFEEALGAVRALVEEEPNHLDALLTLGNLYSLLDEPERAQESFARAIAHEPLCVEARLFGSLAALKLNRLPEARAELSKALFLEPTLAVGHYLLAQVEERLGDRAAARRSYRNAISQLRFTQRPLAGHYPDMPDSAEALSRAARYAMAALEEV